MVVYGTRALTERGGAYALLAIAVRECWGLETLPEHQREVGGKPRFVGLREREFNLSHSAAFALCALDTQPVGVDIQIIKSWRAGLPQRVCSPEELAWLERQPDRWRAFTLIWALKESRVKQSGEGLTRTLSGIQVPIPQAEQGLYQLDGLWFRTYAAPDWMGAVCGLTPPPEEIQWRDCPHC